MTPDTPRTVILTDAEVADAPWCALVIEQALAVAREEWYDPRFDAAMDETYRR